MKQKINKISNANLLESFVQVNFLKGFKYVDRAGEIINKYQAIDGNVAFDMSPDRLIIPSPNKHIKELRISTVDFWCHFTKPSNLGEVARAFCKESEEILGITQPGDIKRIGWRNRYVTDLSEDRESLNGLSKLDAADMLQSQYSLKLTNEVSTNVSLRLLKKNNDSKIALLFDIDTFLTGTFNIKNIPEKLKVIKSVIESEQLVNLVNQVVKLL